MLPKAEINSEHTRNRDGPLRFRNGPRMARAVQLGGLVSALRFAADLISERPVPAVIGREITNARHIAAIGRRE